MPNVSHEHCHESQHSNELREAAAGMHPTEKSKFLRAYGGLILAKIASQTGDMHRMFRRDDEIQTRDAIDQGIPMTPPDESEDNISVMSDTHHHHHPPPQDNPSIPQPTIPPRGTGWLVPAILGAGIPAGLAGAGLLGWALAHRPDPEPVEPPKPPTYRVDIE